jgi:hypothetical protein
MCLWRDGSDDVTVTLQTNPITINHYGVFKRLRQAIIYGLIKTNGSPNLEVTLEGKKTTGNWPELCKYDMDNDSYENLLMRSHYGSQQAFRLTISGSMPSDAFITSLYMNYIPRGRMKK